LLIVNIAVRGQIRIVDGNEKEKAQNVLQVGEKELWVVKQDIFSCN